MRKGEREQGWGTPMHPEHRPNSWKKRMGIREFGILEGSTRIVSDLASPTSFTPSRVSGEAQTLEKWTLGLPAVPFWQVPSPLWPLSLLICTLDWKEGEGLGTRGREALLCNFPAE